MPCLRWWLQYKTNKQKVSVCSTHLVVVTVCRLLDCFDKERNQQAACKKYAKIPVALNFLKTYNL